MTQPKAEANNPKRAGQCASKSILFGQHSRYAVYAVHTRFDSISWVVADAEKTDKAGLATVLRICDTFEQSVRGLN